MQFSEDGDGARGGDGARAGTLSFGERRRYVAGATRFFRGHQYAVLRRGRRIEAVLEEVWRNVG